IHFDRYKGRTLRRHQKRISQYLHYTILDNLQTVKLKEKINDYVMKCVQPKKIIFSIVQQYRYEKTVLPSFNTLCHFITEAYNQYEFSLLSIVSDNISEVQKIGLNELMPLDKHNKGQPYKRAKLVGIKYLNQSTRPAKIKESVNDFLVIKKLYQQLSPLINILPLTPQATQYYAVWVYKARAAQVKQFPKPMKRYLHLIAFIIHQCCRHCQV
ncbi:MAG: DUF4158 domain-containing protein, partial [Gammaproteobacteria bacterium]|nr:DUF4158 domain-containing protein [Gammaproteobacteria bacterium]